MSLEQEFKVLLTKTHYDKLFKHFETKYEYVNTVINTNYYLDTPELDFMYTSTSFRIRKIEDEYTLTMKQKIKVDALLSKKLEFNRCIDERLFLTILEKGLSLQYLSDWLGNDVSIYPRIMASRLVILGQLSTTRTSFNLCNDIEPILLDKSSYLDVVDYELEWETDKVVEAEVILKKQLNEFSISIPDKIESKRSRFMRRYLLKSSYEDDT